MRRSWGRSRCTLRNQRARSSSLLCRSWWPRLETRSALAAPCPPGVTDLDIVRAAKYPIHQKEERMVINGGCLCKAVRYTIAADPDATRVCWCRDCQYFGAGGPTINVRFAKGVVAISGELRGYRSAADSGNTMYRQFCPQCGTPMFTESSARPDIIFVRAGTLDDPNIARPDMTIWTASAPRWACIDSNLPQHPGQPAARA